MSQPETGLDVVRRALAILDEEVRAWLGPPPAPVRPPDETLPPGERAPCPAPDGR